MICTIFLGLLFCMLVNDFVAILSTYLSQIALLLTCPYSKRFALTQFVMRCSRPSSAQLNHLT